MGRGYDVGLRMPDVRAEPIRGPVFTTGRRGVSSTVVV